MNKKKKLLPLKLSDIYFFLKIIMIESIKKYVWIRPFKY